MHILLIGVSLALAGLGGWLCLGLLRAARAWDSRRLVACAGLLLPVVVLSLLAVGLLHLLAQICFQMAPPPDVLLTLSVSVAGVLGLVAAMILNTVRALLLPWYFQRRTWAAPAWLQATAQQQMALLGGGRAPEVRIARDARPWALVAGAVRPKLIVSSQLLALLDADELRAVFSHELLHLQRGDVWWAMLAGMLHDLTWFLPATRHLYRLLRTEQEFACDDGVRDEPRRLALASALARVWQAGLTTGPVPRGALSLTTRLEAASIEARLRRLLDAPGALRGGHPWRAWAGAASVLGLAILAQAGAILGAMTILGCGSQALPLILGWMR